jgi:hypothetical protein
MTITDLPELVAALPPELRAVAARLLHVSRATGTLDPPDEMAPWIERHFGDLAGVTLQTTVRVCNLLTLEEALFNPLRALRPSDAARDEGLEALVASGIGARDLFAAPLSYTPADSFGRVRGRFCVSASNIAKYDGWHGLLVFDEPHPLRFDRERVADYLATAWRWLRAAHSADADARFPLIGWNCLWRSGASLVHGHMQMSLACDRPYAAVERWRAAAEAYTARYGASYFDDLYALHRGLGLAFADGADVRGYASLTPARNRELVLLTPADGDGPPPALARLVADALRALVDGLGVGSFNVALSAPPLPLGRRDDAWAGFPWCVRIVDRGDPSVRGVDVGYMELFGAGVIAADPFDLVADLREQLDKI